MHHIDVPLCSQILISPIFSSSGPKVPVSLYHYFVSVVCKLSHFAQLHENSLTNLTKMAEMVYVGAFTKDLLLVLLD